MKCAQVTLSGGGDKIGMYPIGGSHPAPISLGATRRQELEDMNAIVLGCEHVASPRFATERAHADYLETIKYPCAVDCKATMSPWSACSADGFQAAVSR